MHGNAFRVLNPTVLSFFGKVGHCGLDRFDVYISDIVYHEYRSLLRLCIVATVIVQQPGKENNNA